METRRNKALKFFEQQRRNLQHCHNSANYESLVGSLLFEEEKQKLERDIEHCVTSARELADAANTELEEIAELNQRIPIEFPTLLQAREERAVHCLNSFPDFSQAGPSAPRTYMTWQHFHHFKFVVTECFSKGKNSYDEETDKIRREQKHRTVIEEMKKNHEPKPIEEHQSILNKNPHLSTTLRK